MSAANRRALRGAAVVVLVLSLAWSAGFWHFARRASQLSGPPPHGDGIVVLTGGANRIEAAIMLLAQHRAPGLLISGVRPDLDLAHLLRAAGLRLAPGLASRIVLGHAATSTAENAIETAAWANAHDLHRLIVVTAGYHMQRALADIRMALPNATLLPYPVVPPALARPRSFATLRLLCVQYDKWLLVASGLTEAQPSIRR